MKRYDYVVDIDGEFLGMEETPDGIWVKYEDVEDMRLDFESELRGLDN